MLLFAMPASEADTQLCDQARLTPRTCFAMTCSPSPTPMPPLRCACAQDGTIGGTSRTSVKKRIQPSAKRVDEQLLEHRNSPGLLLRLGAQALSLARGRSCAEEHKSGEREHRKEKRRELSKPVQASEGSRFNAVPA